MPSKRDASHIKPPKSRLSLQFESLCHLSSAMDESPPPPPSSNNEILESTSNTAAEQTSAADSAPVAAADSNGAPSDGGDGSSPREPAEAEPLALADELFEKGSKAIEEEHFVTAVDCLSRALEIRASHYGELDTECGTAYYKYGCALLYKAQEEADPLGNVPKEPANSAASAVIGRKEEESAGGSVTSSKCDGGITEETGKEEATDGGQEAGDGESDDEGGNDGAEADEVDEDDDSDLDLAWKMLDIARVIAEKNSGDTMDKAKIYSALGEVSMEREDFETSLADYQRALSIVENLVEPAHRRIIELNFRICLVLEVGSKIEEAVPYCKKAIILCKTRLQHLNEELPKMQTSDAPLPLPGEGGSASTETQVTNSSVQEKEEEIKAISGFHTELEKKLEDLQQAISNPKSLLSEYLKLVSAKAASEGKDTGAVDAKSFASSSQVGTITNPLDSPAMSTATTNGSVTHLGVVGRGVKRATVIPLSSETPKKPATDKSEKAPSSTPDNPDSANAESTTK